MNVKEKQSEFIKGCLKPKLKEYGFRTLGNNWWIMKGDFFVLINLQNSQWNNKEELSFSFNIGIGLTSKYHLTGKMKPSHFDLAVDLREDAYLHDSRKAHKYRNGSWLGYLITENTDLTDFINELSSDFDNDILPKLGGLKTIEDCIIFFDKYDFSRGNLKMHLESTKIK